MTSQAAWRRPANLVEPLSWKRWKSETVVSIGLFTDPEGHLVGLAKS